MEGGGGRCVHLMILFEVFCFGQLDIYISIISNYQGQFAFARY